MPDCVSGGEWKGRRPVHELGKLAAREFARVRKRDKRLACTVWRQPFWIRRMTRVESSFDWLRMTSATSGRTSPPRRSRSRSVLELERNVSARDTRVSRLARVAMLIIGISAFVIPATAQQELPKAQYKAECPLPPSNGPVFLGQGIPTLYVNGHIAIARDIHWLSQDETERLIGYALTSDSGEIVLVPYTTQHIFAVLDGGRLPSANNYLPLGKFSLSNTTLNAALRKKQLLIHPSRQIAIHRCFRNVWDGKYPASASP